LYGEHIIFRCSFPVVVINKYVISVIFPEHKKLNQMFGELQYDPNSKVLDAFSTMPAEPTPRLTSRTVLCPQADKGNQGNL